MNDANVVCVARDWNEKSSLNISPSSLIRDKCHFIKFIFFHLISYLCLDDTEVYLFIKNESFFF